MSSTMAGFVQLGVLVLLLAAAYVPFGNYRAAVYTDGRHWRVERALYPGGPGGPGDRAALVNLTRLNRAIAAARGRVGGG